MGMKIFVLR
jgi:hypothetical protein